MYILLHFRTALTLVLRCALETELIRRFFGEDTQVLLHQCKIHGEMLILHNSNQMQESIDSTLPLFYHWEALLESWL